MRSASYQRGCVGQVVQFGFDLANLHPDEVETGLPYHWDTYEKAQAKRRAELLSPDAAPFEWGDTVVKVVRGTIHEVRERPRLASDCAVCVEWIKNHFHLDDMETVLIVWACPHGMKQPQAEIWYEGKAYRARDALIYDRPLTDDDLSQVARY